LPPVEEIGVENAHRAAAATAFDGDDAVRVCDGRQRPQHEGVQKTEDRRIGPDSESECEHRQGHKSGTLGK
jgi:hypothetical protein